MNFTIYSLSWSNSVHLVWHIALLSLKHSWDSFLLRIANKMVWSRSVIYLKKIEYGLQRGRLIRANLIWSDDQGLPVPDAAFDDEGLSKRIQCLLLCRYILPILVSRDVLGHGGSRGEGWAGDVGWNGSGRAIYFDGAFVWIMVSRVILPCGGTLDCVEQGIGQGCHGV